jgi:hypothetical protein
LLAGLHQAVAWLPPAPGLQPGPVLPGPSSNSLAMRLAGEADFAVRNARDNAYVHEFDVKPEIGRYHTDCSGLLAHLLRRVDPELELAIDGNKRPVAREYYRHFASAPPAGTASGGEAWGRVIHGADLRPGDVIAREYNPPKPGATGHVLVVTGYPEPVYRDGRVVAYDLRVVDDARHPHDEDTRRSGGAGGVGSGVVSLVVDSAGAISGLVRSRYRSGTGGGPIAVGRINEPGPLPMPVPGGATLAYPSRFNGGREVMVHATPSFDGRRPYTVLLYCHGKNGTNAKSLGETRVGEAVEALNRAGRNVLLVMPQGPEPSSRWMAGPDQPGAMLGEALATYSAQTGIPLPAPQATWAMGHSAGGKAMANLAQHPDTPAIDRYFLADSTYGKWAEELLTALDLRARSTGHYPAISAVVTAHNQERARTQLGRRNIPFSRMPETGPFTGHGGAPGYLLLDA